MTLVEGVLLVLMSAILALELARWFRKRKPALPAAQPSLEPQPPWGIENPDDEVGVTLSVGADEPPLVEILDAVPEDDSRTKEALPVTPRLRAGLEPFIHQMPGLASGGTLAKTHSPLGARPASARRDASLSSSVGNAN